MAENRRHSTRNRGEPPLKLRRASPGQEAPARPGSARRLNAKTATSPISKATPPTKGVKGALRAKAKDSPKPATPVPEPQDVQPEITEDLGTLIERSRQRWINEGGILEKFWTKPPRKRKGQPAVEMPSKAQMNMSEIGDGRLVIEPHVFDIRLYGIKKPALTWQPPVEGPKPSAQQGAAPASTQSVPQNPYPKPQTQQTGPPPQLQNQRGLAPNPYATPPAQAVSQQTQDSSQHPGLSASSKPPDNVQPPGGATTPAAKSQTPAAPAQPPQTSRNPSSSASAPRSSQATSQVSKPVPQASRPVPPPPPTNPPVQQVQAAPHPDPVIQMLAQRASNDPALKELMKVVAAGSESSEKLEAFQKHIDEITKIVQQQRQQQQEALNAGNLQPMQHSGGQQNQQQYKTPSYIQTKPPGPPRYDFTALAFDFIRGGDCYLVPRQSIVQHMPDRATSLISFLVTRKGNGDADSSKLQADKEYYQPMTMSLLTTEQRIRDILSQTVGNKDQVAKEMSDIMERMTLAPEVANATKAKGEDLTTDGYEDRVMHEETLSPKAEDEDVVKAEWDAPHSLLPLK